MRTFGVEEEFLIVSPDSGKPLPLAGEVLRLHELDGQMTGLSRQLILTPELQQEQIEAVTHPHSSLSELGAEIRAGRTYADSLAQMAGARIAALGTSPHPVTPHATSNSRYDAMMDMFALTAREQLTCGCHIHVSVSSDEEGIGVLDRIRGWLAPLIALSTNSPFWNGADSGYASFRTQAWNRWPTAGPTDTFGSAQAYHELMGDLLSTGVVTVPDFDARLSRNYPTVEIRVADVCLNPDDTVLLAALVRALVETAAREWKAGKPADRIPTALLRQGAFRASRWGVRGDLLNPQTHRPDSAAYVIGVLHDHVRDALDEAGDDAFVADSLERILRDGTGTEQQRKAFGRRGQLSDVVAHATSLTHQLPATSYSPASGKTAQKQIDLPQRMVTG
ncbi:carboxylate-amine ligase [Pseudarthrobacter sp. S9]|uniref:carboxylate-amine ligase n=1 Tax=Pseudarthrobacter sp. S9 TaxID=3418421 RepID=UPI003D002373